ncbi:hypothetical protein M3M39_04165 [Fructilactobacillus hinvesii]|uniref:Uncharacterized protein n=1 Tax=Fructilactobacillus hinvesii TaxID=2940300 RepID=A0ABY5BQD0_9LACO|nr:hypothetical protein [Fructilactobacillus hinvesii]USS87324.1 hypothetical protein M3M39_04165 [Fructilactobacillus hinvesii]
MKKSNTVVRSTLKISTGIGYLIATLLIWNLAANSPRLRFGTKTGLIFIAIEVSWALGTLVLLTREDVRLTILFNALPVGLAFLDQLPLIISAATLFYGIVNVCLRVPRLGLIHFYGLICFSLANAVIPVATLNFLTSQYLERSTLLNIGILFTLYVLFYTLRFTPELATIFTLIFIILFAGLILANFPLEKDILLIAIVLLSLGSQIFMRQERFRWCFLTFVLVALLAFYH